MTSGLGTMPSEPGTTTHVELSTIVAPGHQTASTNVRSRKHRPINQALYSHDYAAPRRNGSFNVLIFYIIYIILLGNVSIGCVEPVLTAIGKSVVCNMKSGPTSCAARLLTTSCNHDVVSALVYGRTCRIVDEVGRRRDHYIHM